MSDRMTAFLAIHVGRLETPLGAAIQFDAATQTAATSWACPTQGDRGRMAERVQLGAPMRYAVIETLLLTDGNYSFHATLDDAARDVARDMADLADMPDDYGWVVIDLDADGAEITLSAEITNNRLVTVDLTSRDGAAGFASSEIDAETRMRMAEDDGEDEETADDEDEEV